MGYLPWLISCRLLWLNARAHGEHLICQLLWAAAWLLVIHVCPVYLADELVLVFYCFNYMGSWCFFRKLVWNSRTNLCFMLQGSEMSAGLHSGNASGLRVFPTVRDVRSLLDQSIICSFSPTWKSSILVDFRHQTFMPPLPPRVNSPL